MHSAQERRRCRVVLQVRPRFLAVLFLPLWKDDDAPRAVVRRCLVIVVISRRTAKHLFHVSTAHADVDAVEIGVADGRSGAVKREVAGMSTAHSDWDTLALWPGTRRTCRRTFFSPQIPSAQGEGSLWRKKCCEEGGSFVSANVVSFFSAINTLATRIVARSGQTSKNRRRRMFGMVATCWLASHASGKPRCSPTNVSDR